ncbi:hypothetical protein GMW39_00835 [Pectobacterium parmentieri]|uniref:hypothetical protein n=1 Tax=Pectobacterium parmentieri TaxID=1905730 RepID=UPI001373EBB3|nr:hypothetical protein [Pectobacterium parmentieri]QHQ14554.1 hypothetical protein GMW39_00835 [Pectobacterium parmentieri]
MSTEQNRAAFEKWYESETGWEVCDAPDHDVTEVMWRTWQASRAALVVDIDTHSEFEIEHMVSPEPEKDTYAIGWIDGRNYAATQVSAAGITVRDE